MIPVHVPIVLKEEGFFWHYGLQNFKVILYFLPFTRIKLVLNNAHNIEYILQINVYMNRSMKYLPLYRPRL